MSLQFGIVKSTSKKTVTTMRRVAREMNKEYSTRTFKVHSAFGQTWIATQNQGAPFDDRCAEDGRSRLRAAGLL